MHSYETRSWDSLRTQISLCGPQPEHASYHGQNVKALSIETGYNPA